MSRIPDDVIERLKREVSLERLVASRGIELKRHGADLLGLCPFHEDHEPSLVISPQKNLWHCLGACQAGGTVIDWVMKTEGVSFRHAVELLREGAPLAAAQPVKRSTVAKLAAPLERDADDTRLLGQVVDYYHQTLKASPEALAYLAKRGLQSPELIERFHLGYANRTLGYRLPASTRQAGAQLRGRLQKLGILRESGHEHFNGCLIVPVLDPAGQVAGIYGRKIADSSPPHLYLAGARRGVWNEEALAASPEIILCEALLDALTFWCAGHRNVTSSYGVNGFTDDHREALKKHKTQRVLIAYDRDPAGESAATALAQELLALGIGCSRVLFPSGMDANQYALAGGDLAAALHGAEWISGPAAKETTEVSEPVFSLAADEVSLTLGDRRYRVRGLAKNPSRDMLKVNLLVSRGAAFHLDTLDLYSARQRAVFQRQAAAELELQEDAVKRDLGRVLLELEQLQDQRIRQAQAPPPRPPAMSEPEREAALALLQEPRLLERILEDFARCGVVGEETNKLVGYLAAISRHLEAPLAVVVQSSSAAGKSSLMEAILAFVPEEERVEYSAITGQSLFYMAERDLKHKVLAIAEQGGASRAAYALKLLQSEGVLTIASTGKDPATGRLVTHEYRVEGPVMIFLTTTAIDLDEELLNRCLVLTVNEDRRQTQAIHRLQREQQTIEGLLARQDRAAILKLHRNAQRLLKPLFVANPYARELTFLDSLTRTRRDHVKYLTLIRAIALLHQYQRPPRTARGLSYIEATLDDIETANRLAHEVLGRSLDELPPQTRRLLLAIEDYVRRECARLALDRPEFRFSRRDLRQHTGWGDTQLRVHLRRLEELEYLLVHRGGRGQSFVYELVFESRGDGNPVLPGLIDACDLENAASTRPQNGGVAGGARVPPTSIATGLGAHNAAAKA
jgi:DNA primase catalytic core